MQSLAPVNARRGMSVGVVIRLRTEGLSSRRSMSGKGNFSSPKLREAGVGITQGTRSSFLGMIAVGHEVYHLALSNVERMNARRYTSTPPHAFTSCYFN